MKRMIVSIFVVIIAVSTTAEAQNGNPVKKQSRTNQAGGAEAFAGQNASATGDTISLMSVSSNEAFRTDASRQFSIADPTINALKQQAWGNTPLVSPSGVVGMPKRAYGFSNGKILLRPTTSATSGTLYGSGSVGTGTSLMGLGAGERAIGVNGKNPQYGNWFWGSKSPVRNLPPSYRDSLQAP